MKRELFYVGEDRDLIALLEEDSQARGWQWTVFKGYEELAHYLRGKKRSPDKPPSGMELRLWLRERLTPIVLDIDFEQSNAVEIVRDIKTIDGASPLFVVSQQPSLTTISLAWTDGAEAYFTKPLDNLDGLIEAIEEAFDKVDRWERTLRQIQEHAKSPVSSA